MYRRLSDFYQSATTSPLTLDVLPQALMELGSVSEMVEIATEELHQQNEELTQTRSLVEAERQRYQDLFEFAPDCYLVTDGNGVIQEANRAAARMLKVTQQFLVGKLMITFVASEERHRFRNELTQICQSDKVRELLLRLQRRSDEYMDAAITVAACHNSASDTINLRWLIRDVTEHRQVERTTLNPESDPFQNRPVSQYSKGEIIPLGWQSIFCVRRGLVKLSTHCETGEEVLVGLVGEGMVFSSSMTGLHTYQATTMSNVELVSISVTEMLASPTLSHALLPKINQRLRQTESFLVVSGRRRVEDRFYHLLRLLKQEIGQPVTQGTRLSVRLTHEDLASGCCTTRVTITRLIGKLQKQGKIGFDSKKHLIIKDMY
ncbi:PAS domain S-box protein [Iningainema tapete]|nr:PAS domain-containing protein [Iningainema tapete]